MNLYAVVVYRKRGPLQVNGPYLTRAAARDVLELLKDEEQEEPLGNRARIVPMYYLMTRADVNDLLHNDASNA